MPSDLPGVYRATTSGDALAGQPLAWAYVDGYTLTVHSLVVLDGGGYVMQTYHRTLSDMGMALEFISIKNGETARRVEEAVRFALSRRATARVGVPLGHGPPAILSLVPLGASQPAVLQEAVTPRPLLLATIVDPFRHRGSPRALLQDLYGLTPAECALAVLLRDGHSLRQAAGIRSVAYPTARNQLASILGKLQLHSQSELRAFLARLSLVEPEGEGAP